MCGRKVRVSCFSAPARSRSSILAVVAACAVLGSPFSKLHAQAITGVIVGTVQDATGGVVRRSQDHSQESRYRHSVGDGIRQRG